MATLSFKPKQVGKRIIGALPNRAQEVILKRYGLDGEKRQTLESIGNIYGITRERVRQIENFAIAGIKKSSVFQKESAVFDELEKYVKGLGGVVAEKDLLESISKEEQLQNYITLFLVLGDSFTREKEDEYFKDRWVSDKELADTVHDSLKKLYASLSDADIISEGEMVTRFLDYVKDVSEQYKNEEIARRWLALSKKIAKNPLGEWGPADSPNIRVRGMRDYAFLVLRRHGSPIHFSDVAKSIEKLFDKKAHTATCHNELIKDPRFVLVGRGLYALTEWGYASGVVRDVITHVLNEHGPLSKEEIVEKVLTERYVKPNTIMVNLQNSKYFKRDKEGRYTAL